MRIMQGLFVVLAMLLVIGCLGCGASRPRGATHHKALDTDTVVIVGSSLTNRLSRQDEWTERRNGYLVAHVVLRNNSGKQLNCEIRTYFKGRRGQNLATGSDIWDPVVIAPYQDFHYERLSRDRTAEGYQLHVRLAEHDKQ